jgi:hypothetical protein
MRHRLHLHPDSVCEAVMRLEVDVERPRPNVLALTYVATGAIADLRLAPPAAPERADELWMRTCFEAFVRPLPGEAYFEFNMAPSGQWATYRFDGYRAGMSAPGEVTEPLIGLQASGERLDFRVELDLGRLAGLAPRAAWRVGVSTVIEETNGRKSYWALTHPPGKADFHHADGFALELAGTWPR